MKIISVVGARPNFIKIAPFIRAIVNHNSELIIDNRQPITANIQYISHLLVHTGQHYDDKMSLTFFESLDIPEADINLGVGSGTHSEQVGNTMIEFEKVLISEKPDWVVVVGDVNATLACSVTAKKEHIKVCHIEAGLRSGDLKMPEEINRLVTDRLSDLLLTPDTLSIVNLKKEGIDENHIVFVGNIMIDTLDANMVKASELDINTILTQNRITDNRITDNRQPTTDNRQPPAFALLTLHRPSNVDDRSVFEPLCRFLMDEVTNDMPVFWPIHPRAEKQLKSFGLWDEITSHPRMIMLHPLGYHELLRLNLSATLMLTDSGGLQEECTVLGTPCLTLRWNTERPVTLREQGGASVLVGNNIRRIREEYLHTKDLPRIPSRPPLWDGQTAGRCLEAILSSGS